MWQGRYCDRCECEHMTMEMCPKAPGYLQLMRSWFSGDRTDPMVWGAVLVTFVLVFVGAFSIFSLAHG